LACLKPALTAADKNAPWQANYLGIFNLSTIGGNSLVRMPDQQVLPLQFLKSFVLFFVPKGFN
jgi:hypothetical protein